MLIAFRRSKPLEQLHSSNTHTHNFKYTYSIEIVPICKDDFVCIPLKQAQTLSNITSALLWPTPRSSNLANMRHSIFNLLASAVRFSRISHRSCGVHGVGHRGGSHSTKQQICHGGCSSCSGRHVPLLRRQQWHGGLELSRVTNQIFHTRTHLGSIL